MEDRVIQFRVGAVVICGLFVAGILILLSGDIDWVFKQPYTVFVETPTAPGVTTNTPVRKHGIRIGYVSDIESRDRGVRLTLKIDGDQKIYSSDIFKIGTASLLGDAVIDILPGLEVLRGEEFTDGTLVAYDPDPRRNRVFVDFNPVELLTKFNEVDFSSISASVESMPEAIGAVRDAGRSIEAAANNVTQITDRVQDILGNEELNVDEIVDNIRNMSEKAEQAIDNFNSMMTNLNSIVGDEEIRESLRKSLADAPRFMEEVQATISETKATLESFKSLADRAETNLGNIESFTKALGDRGPELVDELESSLTGAGDIVQEINDFSKSLNNPNGTISRLLNDPEIYRELSRTMANVREISFKLKPIINDARFLMDGLARDPAQVVRGALDNRPPGAGYKGTMTGGNDF